MPHERSLNAMLGLARGAFTSPDFVAASARRSETLGITLKPTIFYI
jgi:hypothetical protein